MNNKLFLIGMFTLNTNSEKEETKTHYSAVVEMLKGNVREYSNAQKEQMLNHALYLDNKYVELEYKKFQSLDENAKNAEARSENMYKDSVKSKNMDRFFLWGLIGILVIYIIYKGTTDSKSSVEI